VHSNEEIMQRLVHERRRILLSIYRRLKRNTCQQRLLRPLAARKPKIIIAYRCNKRNTAYRTRKQDDSEIKRKWARTSAYKTSLINHDLSYQGAKLGEQANSRAGGQESGFGYLDERLSCVSCRP